MGVAQTPNTVGTEAKAGQKTRGRMLGQGMGLKSAPLALNTTTQEGVEMTKETLYAIALRVAEEVRIIRDVCDYPHTSGIGYDEAVRYAHRLMEEVTKQAEPFCHLIDDEGYEESNANYPGAFPVFHPSPDDVAALKAENERLRAALEFCSGTSYIDDAHRVADEALTSNRT